MYKNLIRMLVLFTAILPFQTQAQRSDEPWQLDLAAGLSSYYAPIKSLNWSRPELVTQVGYGKPLGSRQLFSVGLQLGYARNNYQGDALYLQLVGQITPVIANKLELGLGLGFGYRMAMYPSRPQVYDQGKWKEGKAFKSVYQVPVQLSIGYRSILLNNYTIRPYLAYQLQPLFRYSPDLSPLPVSNTMLGLKIQQTKK